MAPALASDMSGGMGSTPSRLMIFKGGKWAVFTTLSQWEGPFLLWVQEVARRPWLDKAVAFYTRLGDRGVMWIALTLLFMLFPKTRKAGITGAVALLFSFVFTNFLIKPLFARPRPWLVLEGLVHLVDERDPNSFPSGHTSAAFAAAGAWLSGLKQRRTKVAVLLAAFLIALSRLYVGVHFPTDVCCGALAGLFCGRLAARTVQIWEERKERLDRASPL